jgi:RNA polymerase II subunit A small phosphatase-like protein
MLGRHRNGSALSNHSGVGTGPTSTPENSQPNSPAVASHKKKKKSGGIMALFGCCGVPDHANGLEAGDDQPSHKVEKLAPRPATASRRTATPSEQPSSSRTHLYEKESLQQSQNTPENHKTGKRVSGASTQDQSTVGERDAESKQTTLVGTSAPQVTVEPPRSGNPTTSEEADGTAAEGDAEGDIGMPDAEASSRQQAKQPASGNADEPYVPPPPPPGPVPAVPNAPVADGMPIFAPDQPQKFLLPVQAPEFKGKKCLVLDLDETLVHSSFKVGAEPALGKRETVRKHC